MRVVKKDIKKVFGCCGYLGQRIVKSVKQDRRRESEIEVNGEIDLTISGRKL